MQIEQIILNNFRNHKHTVIEFTAPVSVITGPNASGKSSIKEAILYALTGDGRNNTARGDLSNIILYGTTKAEVILTLKTDTSSLEITRSRTAKGESLKVKHNGELLSGSLSEIQHGIYEILETDKQSISYAFDGALLYTMSPKERKEYIFDLLNINVTPEALTEALKNTGIDSTYWQDLIPLALEKGFQETEKEAVSLRKLAKRQSKDPIHKVPDHIVIGEKKYNLPEIDIQSVMSHLNALEHERERLLIEKGRLQAEKAHSIDALKNSENKFLSLLKEAEDELSTLKEQEYEKKKAHTIDEVNVYTKKHIETQKALAEGQALLQSREKLAALDFSGNFIYFSDLPCASIEQIKERKEQIEQEISELKNLIARITSEADQYKEIIKQRSEDIHEITRQLERERFLEERITEYMEELSALNEQISQQSQKEDQGVGLSLQDTENTIRDLTCRIQHGNDLLKAVDLWNKYNEKVKVQEETQKEISAYDKLAHFFGPSGYMKEALTHSLSPLYDRLKKTEPILGYSLRFDDDFNILADGKSIKNLSESERYRVGIILQDAFIHLTGIRVMAIDEVNILDQPNKGLLLQTLLALCNDYSTILLFSTLGETVPKPSQHPLITMMRTDQGKVFKVLRKAA